MARNFPASVEDAASKRGRGRWKGHKNSRSCVCSVCGREFDRGYAINATRASKPQFCSKICFDVELVRRTAKRFGARLWSRIDRRGPDECWPWTGRRGAHGYGMLDIDHRPHVASRVVYKLVTGDEPQHVCHKCDNPPCCNPAHLFGGTAADNHADMMAKGRWVPPRPRRGSDNNASRLTEDDVIKIFRSPLRQKDLAEKYGVTGTAIGLIKRGINWGWLTETLNG